MGAVNAGRYPDLAARGAVPDLLTDPAAGSALVPADITAVSVECEPMGLGAITDLVQHAFGPVDLDRSPVELATLTAARPGCPACAGGRFGFPGALTEARNAMCPAHHREAESVINRRLARANASNPDGWAAVADASLAIDRPHLPNGLAASGDSLSSHGAAATSPDAQTTTPRLRAKLDSFGCEGHHQDLRQRYGVDKYTTYADLTAIGFTLPPSAEQWSQRRPPVQHERESDPDTRADDDWTMIDGRRYFVAGYTPNGVPYGIFEDELDDRPTSDGDDPF